MKPNKQSDHADNTQLIEASKKAKKALDEWQREHVEKRLEPLIWGWQYDELALIIKLLQLKLRNLP